MKNKNDKVEVLADELAVTGEVNRLTDELAEAVGELEKAVKREKDVQQLVTGLESEHAAAATELDAALARIDSGVDVARFVELMGKADALEKIVATAKSEQGIINQARWCRERACKEPHRIASILHEALVQIEHKRACKKLEGQLASGAVARAAWGAKSVAAVSHATLMCPPTNRGADVLEATQRVLTFAKNYK